MHELIHRLLVLLWFLSYMASIYLALHMLVARFSRAPGQPAPLVLRVMVTAPLTRPVRRSCARRNARGPGPLHRAGLALIVLCGRHPALLGAMGGLDLG